MLGVGRGCDMKDQGRSTNMRLAPLLENLFNNQKSVNINSIPLLYGVQLEVLKGLVRITL